MFYENLKLLYDAIQGKSISNYFIQTNDSEEIRDDHSQFGSVIIKRIIKSKFFYKKTETGSNQSVSVRFCFYRTKPVQTGLTRFFLVWLGFFNLTRFFAGLALFFRFGFGLIFSVLDL